MRGLIAGVGLVLGGCLSVPSSVDEDAGAASDAAPPGDGAPAPDAGPPAVIVQLALGADHTCVLLDDGGKVRCFGRNNRGQLGYGNEVDLGDDEPASTGGDVALGGRAVQLAAGAQHTCALLSTGAVRCWGAGDRGQLGYGDTADVGDDETPADAGDIGLAEAATAIAAGGAHTCALLSSASVRCWGANDSGQLGYGDTAQRASPGAAVSITDADVLAKGVAAGAAHTCALLADGTIKCWGNGDDGALGYGNASDVGDGETPAQQVDPANVGGVSDEVASGGRHTCARQSNGAVRCWGAGADGRLGYGNVNAIGDGEAAGTGGDVALGDTAVQLALGTDHSCARLTSGVVRCWGLNASGQLGFGGTETIGDNDTPITPVARQVELGGTPAVEIDAGGRHTCARLQDGRVLCWGAGDRGQLGRGDDLTIGDDELPADQPALDVGPV